ncbi:MAG: hypothetical protein ACR2NZ_01565, partial [Rubripirellula sp.]
LLPMYAMILCGSMGGLLMATFGASGPNLTRIDAVERLGFSPRRALIGGLCALPAGAVFWLIFRLSWREPNVRFFWQSSDQNVGYWFFLFALLLIAVEVGLLLGGLVTQIHKGKTRPNQGVRLSFRNGATTAAAFTIVVLLTVLLIYFLQDRSAVDAEGRIKRTTADGFLVAFTCATIPAYCAFLYFGGIQCLKHVCLRVVLWCGGEMPANLPRLLRDTTKLGLTRQVGGGFIFLHRLLMEYFANQGSESPKSS